jgi:formate dehydrogenase assembly factor FdhD
VAVQPLRLTEKVEHDGVADRVAVEEPLEIRVRGAVLAATMRTPGTTRSSRSDSCTARG